MNVFSFLENGGNYLFLLIFVSGLILGDVYIRYDLRLSFEESVFGVKREIKVSYLETCDGCGGTGAKSSNAIKQCSSCGGKGRVMDTQRTPFGMMSQVTCCTQYYSYHLPFLGRKFSFPLTCAINDITCNI